MAIEGNILPVNIEDEMRKSYIDYAMSVIVGRALPDVRDGLKPIHRRILYSMYQLGLMPDKGYRKSAFIVGDVMGKYHPHGDAAIYETLVRLAQDFSIRYPLVDGHGNFGSIDGDPPAAQRYTEARLSKIAVEMLTDLDKQTVDFMPNFEETLQEPKVLPSRFPNLLVNGSQGIAVGMATNIPPHNLGEAIDAVIKTIENPDITIDELLNYIKGPDFPTGGIILGYEGIREAYTTGRGKIIVRAKTEIEQVSETKTRIIVKEIPYMVNKARLIEKIAELVRDKKIEGIADLRDESDRSGMRIVIELKRDTNPNVVLNRLYAHTQLQDTFGVIMLALVDGQPKVLTLKEIIHYYIEHQKDVVVRRTRYELNKAQDRAHILEGLKIALDHIDAIINLIRSSPTVQVAKDGLMKNFNLSDVQAQAILDMRLQRLTGLERKKIDEEYDEIMKKVQHYKEILANEWMVLDIIKNELSEIKNKFADERRTLITHKIDEINVEDLIEKQDMVVTMTHFGYIKRLSVDAYKTQKRGGKGILGMDTKEDDFVENIFTTTTHDQILFFTNMGRVFKLKTYEIPEAGRQSKGTAIINLLSLKPNERVNAVISLGGINEDMVSKCYLAMVTRNGLIKKTKLSEFENIRKDGIIAIKLNNGDELISVKLTNGDDELIIGTSKGMAIRFNEKDVRPMGRSACGVKAMALNDDDYIIGMDLVDKNAKVLLVTKNGYGKRTELSEFRTQSRGGKGLIASNITDKTGELVAIMIVKDDDDVMLITSNGTLIRTAVSSISVMHRNAQGVKIMDVNGDVITSIDRIAKEDD